MNSMPKEYEGCDLVAMARKLERYDASHGTEGVQVDGRFLDALCCRLERAEQAYDRVTAALEGGAGNPLVQAMRERDDAIRRHNEHTKLLCDAHVAAYEKIRIERDATRTALHDLRSVCEVIPPLLRSNGFPDTAERLRAMLDHVHRFLMEKH